MPFLYYWVRTTNNGGNRFLWNVYTYLCTRSHGIIYENTALFIFDAVKTRNNYAPENIIIVNLKKNCNEWGDKKCPLILIETRNKRLT
jgi:hypothetical protein